MMFFVFDFLQKDGVDLRHLSWSERKRDLQRLCRKARVPCMRVVETFPDGDVLLEHCDRYGFEAMVSKRLASTYASGASKAWMKTKCPQWKRDNTQRHKLFEEAAR